MDAASFTGEDFLGQPQVVALTGISRETIRRYAASGRLPSIDVGGHRIYRRGDVTRLLEDLAAAHDLRAAELRAKVPTS